MSSYAADPTDAYPDRDGPRTYGGYRAETSPGLFSLGTLGTVFLFVAFIVVLLVWQTAGLGPGLLAFAVSAAMLAALLIRDRNRRNLLTRAGAGIGWLRTRRAGAHLYRSGPLSHHAWGTHPLPGLAADTALHEFTDSYGRPVALLHWRSTGDLTVVLRAEPEGQALVDEDQIDNWVANYALWLAGLADEPGLVGATVIIETAEDSGTRMRTRIAARADPRAHPIPLAALREAADTFPVGTPSVTAWVTLTYTGDGKADVTAAGRDLATRVAGLAAGLSDTGAGAAGPVPAQDLCEQMLIIFDPDKQAVVDAARAAGTPLDLSWDDIGPVAADAYRDHYRHNRAASVTWEMTTPPRGVHLSSILTPLLAPRRGLRKRVALHYQVVPPWRAARTVDAGVRAAEFKVSQSKKPSARAVTELRAARQTADEEAHGAALLQVAMTVTVTDPDGPADLKPLTSSIDNVSASARVRLRIQGGSQDSAFLSATPVGVVYPRHLRTPAQLRTAL